MLIVGMEVMFFTGLISAFMIVKAGVKPGVWPPPWQPRLPIEITGVNTLVLIASGVLLFVAAKKMSKSWMLLSMALGATFVAVQGIEWVRLLGEGLSLTSSNHGAFFYLIVGVHGLHCIGGLLALAWVWNRLRVGRLQRSQMTAMQIFWTFVVGLWPLLYTLVYLL
jgi:heme/copper-type cytochrome/quinol oxidase subunit 3